MIHAPPEKSAWREVTIRLPAGTGYTFPDIGDAKREAWYAAVRNALARRQVALKVPAHIAEFRRMLDERSAR